MEFSILGIVPTAREIAKEYFPYVSESILTHIILGETGYPHFWNIPKDGVTPEECFRKQLKEFAEQS